MTHIWKNNFFWLWSRTIAEKVFVRIIHNYAASSGNWINPARVNAFEQAVWRPRDLVQDSCRPPAPPRRVAPLTLPAVRSGGEALVRPVVLHLEPAAGAEGGDGSVVTLESSQHRKSGEHFEGHLLSRGADRHIRWQVVSTVRLRTAGGVVDTSQCVNIVHLFSFLWRRLTCWNWNVI